MHHYDIAAKVLVESCRDELIRQFVGIDVRESTVIEQLPQETVSVKTSDFPVMLTDAQGIARLVILEIQTEWKPYVPLNLLDYRTRYLLKHDIDVFSCVILLRPSGSATDCYQDNEVRFRYRLVKIYELDARSVIDKGQVCLLPFVPLMKNGAEQCDRADELIYTSGKTKSQKADMLTSMAILSGLISKELPMALISRRRDIMIESAAYDIIKDEGWKEGLLRGIEKGIEQGVRQGRQEGILIGERKGLLESAKFILETKFGARGLKFYAHVQGIEDIDGLRLFLDAAKIAKTAEELQAFMEDGPVA